MSIFYGLVAAGTWTTERGRNLLDGGAPFYSVYETGDGLYVSIAALENKFFAELARLIGLDTRFVQRQMDRSLWPELRAQMSEIFKRRTRAQWCELLEGTDACFAPVLSMTEAPGHAHNTKRGVFVELNGFAQPAPAPRFSRSPPDKPQPPPEIGTHTQAVLEEAGFDGAAIQVLRNAGVIG
jgi:alpha-methylacyl-CoA racemase